MSSRLDNLVIKLGNCWGWSGKFEKGVPMYGKRMAVRVLWEQAHGRALKRHQKLVRFCSSAVCVNPACQFVHSTRGREQDKSNRKYGDENISTKVSDADVNRMRELYENRANNGVTQSELAEEFGVSQAQVSRILTGKRRQTD